MKRMPLITSRLLVRGSLTALFAVGSVYANAQSGFLGGDLAVSLVSSGAALSGAATQTSVAEYSLGGSLVQTINMPTAASGSNHALTNSGTATSEGGLTLSPDGTTLALAGYDAALGTASVANTASATTARVIGLLNVNTGVLNTSTALTDAYSGNNIRSAVYSGSNIYTAGTGTNAGFRVTTVGGTTSTQLASAPTNARRVDIYNGQLYGDSASGTTQSVGTIGTGLPTTSGQTFTLLPGLPSASGPSPYDFFFANSSTLYIADDRVTASGGGLQKWTFNGSTWSLSYTLTTNLTAGLRGVTGFVDQNGVTNLFAVTADATSNKVVSIADLGAASPFTTVATAATNSAFRGIRYIPGKSTGTTPAPSALLPFVLGLPLVGAKLRNRRKAALR